MDRRSIAAILSFIGVLCFISIGFSLLPANVATFAGIACFMASGLVWSLPFFRQDR
jgi:hypothetical protein